MHTQPENNCCVSRFLCLDGIGSLHYDFSLFVRYIQFFELLTEFGFFRRSFQIISILLHILVYVVIRSFENATLRLDIFFNNSISFISMSTADIRINHMLADWISSDSLSYLFFAL